MRGELLGDCGRAMTRRLYETPPRAATCSICPCGGDGCVTCSRGACVAGAASTDAEENIIDAAHVALRFSCVDLVAGGGEPPMMLPPFLPRAFALVLLLLVAAGPASSPTTSPTTSPTSARASQPLAIDEAQTAKLIQKLGDEDWKVREAASKDLLNVGEAARGPLERAASNSANPELKLRAEALLATLSRPEVHVVGVYEPGGQHFRMIGMRGQDIEWAKFCEVLAEQAKRDGPSPAKRLWERLPETSREIVADKDQVQRIDNLVNRVEGGRWDRQAQRNLRQLTTALDEALRRPDFFDEDAFAG